MTQEQTPQPVRGMNDVLPSEIALWHRLEDAARATFAAYGYQELRTPIVERTDLIAPLGRWILHRACLQGRAWLNSGLEPMKIAVNLSPAQFDDPRLVSHLRQTHQRDDGLG